LDSERLILADESGDSLAREIKVLGVGIFFQRKRSAAGIKRLSRCRIVGHENDMSAGDNLDVTGSLGQRLSGKEFPGAVQRAVLGLAVGGLRLRRQCCRKCDGRNEQCFLHDILLVGGSLGLPEPHFSKIAANDRSVKSIAGTLSAQGYLVGRLVLEIQEASEGSFIVFGCRSRRLRIEDLLNAIFWTAPRA